jgi:hypothetical protein
MGYTSKMASMQGVHFIDTDLVHAHGDPEAFSALSVKQPYNAEPFSKGMFSTEEATEEFTTKGGVVIPGLGARVPFSAGASGAFPSEYLFKESEYEARIKEMETAGADIMARSLIGTNGKEFLCKDQNGTNFCWANAPTYCFETARLYANDELIYFSPGSTGVAPASIYPVNQIRKPNNFDAAMTAAASYKVLEWWELQNLNEVVSCLLRGWPVAVGLNWWSHEVSYTNALWVDGTLCIGFRNSWGMSYGNKGFSILQGSRMRPDDAVTPRVASPAGTLAA